MRRLYLAIFLTITLCLITTMVLAQGRTICYTTWDDFYFYAAFQVDDPDVSGTNSAPNSNPWEDDCVEVFIESDNKRAAVRTENTCSMVVSPAGGSGFTVGQDGKPFQVPVVTYKYSQTVQGSLNDSDDVDVGYQVEMAIPWELIKVTPKPGTMMGFNVICRMKGEKEDFISLSPDVKTEEDIQNPSKWVNIVLSAPTFGASTLDIRKIVSARYIARRPTIDGKISEKEYNKNTSFELAMPETPAEIARQRPKRSLQKFVFTRYIYDYQGDPRKPMPFANVRDQDGRLKLTNFPVSGAGPWFSFDRVEWHKQELSDMRRAGIDVVLPVYRGDLKSRSEYALKGLDSMVQALYELRNERKEYPLVGLFFDTECLSAALDGKCDLRDDISRKSFYGMLKTFFQRVPSEFLAQANITDDRAGYPTYIVFIGPSPELTGCDDALIDYVNKQFAADFNARLAWVLPASCKTGSEATDGFCSYPAGMSVRYDEDGLIRLAAVGPGYDDSAQKSKPYIRGRNNGETYKKDWSEINTKRPNWVLVDSWNDFKQGSEVCGSRQYGYVFTDATAVSIGKLRGAKQYDAKFLRHDTPRILEQGRFYQVHLLVRNDGTEPLSVKEGFALSYRWFKDGRPVEEGLVKRPIQKDILPGKTEEITIGLAAVAKDNQPLPDGDYEIYYEFIRLTDNKWLSALGDEPYIIPVSVGKPEELAVTFASVDAPTMMKAGGSYLVKAKVRNDGTRTWTKDEIQIGCRIWKVSNYTGDVKEDAEHPADAAPLILALPKDLAPGEEIEVEGFFAAKDSQGNPLPVTNLSDSSFYLLKWELLDGANWIADAGTYTQSVGIYSSDPGPQFIASDIPQTMFASKEYSVKVMVKNRGAEPWQPDVHKIGYHWYYLDGTEAQWDCPLTEIKKPVKPARLPGDVEFITARVVAPPYDGQYIFVWDLKEGDEWASTCPISHGGDMVPAFVEVKDGRLSFVDLSKVFDVAAASPDSDPASGDFDGSGRCFPSEMLPPDVSASKAASSVYPSGYFRSVVQSGEEVQRNISFSYGPDDPGQKNAVSCAGQNVEITKGSYTVLHILGAATEPEAVGKIGLAYGAESVSADITMSAWTEGPKHGELIGFESLHIHGKEGDVPGVKGYLYHYKIKLDPARELTGITLPNNPNMRITAMTLEKG